MNIVTVIERVVKRHGGQLTRGECYRSTGMTKPQANSLAAELKLRHFQVRAVAEAKDGTWEVVFR